MDSTVRMASWTAVAIWGALFAARPLSGQEPIKGEPQRPLGAIAEESVPWEPLVVGNGTDGWRQLGGKARYEVSDGVVTGIAVHGTPNSFLATERTFGDFILELEFKVDPRLNSGVQIRSNSLPEYRNGVVHGYQVEIDPSDRAWTGGIYDESRRGWLNPLKDNEAARKAFRQGEWNRFRVEARGPHIETWVNGVPAADLIDTETMTGFIALQVHGIPSKELEGATVQWRNIRIKDLGRHEWRPLMPDESLAGWTATPGGDWQWKEGVLHGTSPASEARHGILLSDREFGNFTLRHRFRVRAGNSGFYFRVEKVDSSVAVHGFQAEVDGTMATGGLYETGGRAWVAQPDPDAMAKVYQPGEWAQMSVSAHGRRVTVHVNGFRTADLVDDPGRVKGHLGFQLHGGQEMDVEFKDIEILVPAGSSAE